MFCFLELQLTLPRDDVLVSCGGDDDVNFAEKVVDANNPEPVHASLV